MCVVAPRLRRKPSTGADLRELPSRHLTCDPIDVFPLFRAPMPCFDAMLLRGRSLGVQCGFGPASMSSSIVNDVLEITSSSHEHTSGELSELSTSSPVMLRHEASPGR